MSIKQPIEIPAIQAPPINPGLGGNGLQVIEIAMIDKGATNKFLPKGALVVCVAGCAVIPERFNVQADVSLGLIGVDTDGIMPSTVFVENTPQCIPVFVYVEEEREIQLTCEPLDGAEFKFVILYQQLNPFA